MDPLSTRSVPVPSLPAPAVPLHHYGHSPQGDGAVEPMPGPKIGFNDVLRALNPLQHIPVVGQIWRHVTGDTIEPAFRVLGGAVLGGPIGAIVSAVTTFAESAFASSGAPSALASAAPVAGPAAAAQAGASVKGSDAAVVAQAGPERAMRGDAMRGSGPLPLPPGPGAEAMRAPVPAGVPVLAAAKPLSAPIMLSRAMTVLPSQAAEPRALAAREPSANRPRSRFDASDRPDPLYEASRRLTVASRAGGAGETASARPLQMADARPAASWSARLPAREGSGSRVTGFPQPADPRADLVGNRLPGPIVRTEDFVGRVMGGLAAYDRTSRLRGSAAP